MTNILSYYPDTVTNLSLKDYFALLLENTCDNGILYIPDEESACALRESDDVFRLEMDWNEESVKDLLAEAENLKTTFAEILKAAPENEETAKKLLSPENFSIWSTYLRSFDTSAFDKEKLAKILEKDYNVEALTPAEEEFYNRYNTDTHAEAAARLGNSLNAYETIFHAMRYVKLLNIDAPEVVKDNEFRLFALNFAIHHFAKSKSTVTALISATVFVKKDDFR